MKAKYIKLGNKGEWEAICLQDGTLRLGYYEAPHEAALRGDKELIRNIYLEGRCTPQVAANHARQILNFYENDSEIIWITFSRGCMWWCQAEPEVEFLGSDRQKQKYGSRLRRATKGWSNVSVGGKTLAISRLSGRLTRLAGFQGTICDVGSDALEHLDGAIHDREHPRIIETKIAQDQLQEKVSTIITHLTWKDFELFVEILFSRSGWLRVSESGKLQKDIDLEYFIPITEERILVQVKSNTNQSEFDQYAEKLLAYGADKVFYVYHSASRPIYTSNARVKLLGASELAAMAVNYGLVRWLIDKA
jgi:hypothetical protein